MGSISGALIFYLLFLFIGLVTGSVFWVIHRYSLAAVLALIISLLAPLMALLVAAQRDSNIGAFAYIMEEVGAGNTWARILFVLHVYLIGWLIFLAVRGIMRLLQSPQTIEKIKRIFVRKTLSSKESAQEKQANTGN